MYGDHPINLERYRRCLHGPRARMARTNREGYSLTNQGWQAANRHLSCHCSLSPGAEAALDGLSVDGRRGLGDSFRHEHRGYERGAGMPLSAARSRGEHDASPHSGRRRLGKHPLDESLQSHIDEITEGDLPWEDAAQRRDWWKGREVQFVARMTRKLATNVQLIGAPATEADWT